MKIHSFEVGGIRFETRSLPVKESVPYKVWFSKLMAPFFLELQDAVDKEAAAAKAIGRVVNALDAKEVLSLLASYAKYTTFTSPGGEGFPREGSTVVVEKALDQLFSANGGELIDFILECTRFNFESFFHRALQSDMAGATKSVSAPVAPLNGTFGA